MPPDPLFVAPPYYRIRSVIPAKAGSQSDRRWLAASLGPRLRRGDGNDLATVVL
jgi:hypothetical protein